MFFFGKKKNSDAETRLETAEKLAIGAAATNTAMNASAQAAKTFWKPENYTGNRHLYDSGKAKADVKINSFENSGKVYDPYTSSELKLRKIEAKEQFGSDWQNHLAEGDHITPVERIHRQTKNNPWLKNDDIKNIANSDENLQAVSRKFNNAKRNRTNEEFVTDDEYLQKTGVELTDEGKRKAIEAGKKSQKAINKKITKTTVSNALKTGHNAGVAGAQSAGMMTATMSGAMNIVAVIKGEKTVDEALADTAKDTGKAAVTGYAVSGGLTTLCHSLSNSSSKFIQGLIKSNVPGQIITAVMVTGNTLKRYGNGEISTQECIIELGEKGLNFATAGYSMAVGQTLIPIPVVGAAIGCLVGTMLTSGLYNNVVNRLKQKQLEHEERMNLIEEYSNIAEQAKAYRQELETYLENYFKDFRECFDTALYEIESAFKSGDTDGVILGANMVTEKLGGQVKYRNMNEFKSFIASDEVDIL